MGTDHAGTPASDRFWDDPAVARALDAAISHAADSGLDRDTAEAVTFDAISHHARDRTATAVGRARERGTSWATLAAAFGLTRSGVRHRYDPSTVAQHRASERRRRHSPGS